MLVQFKRTILNSKKMIYMYSTLSILSTDDGVHMRAKRLLKYGI
nr:MAG TPA: hypothetical protein [Caudoviricetes sp.]